MNLFINLRKFFGLKTKDKALFFEALLLLCLAKLMLAVLPFRKCILTLKNGKSDTRPDIEQLKSIKDSIIRATRLTRWKNVCLVQSFAARWMLQRRGIPSYFKIGVNNNSRLKFVAHAWITAGGIEIVSKGGFYTIIDSY